MDASGNQIRYIKLLTEQRLLTQTGLAMIQAKVAAHEADLAEPGTGKRISLDNAGAMIDLMKALPFKPRESEAGQATRPTSAQPAAPGVYQKDGRIYVVREFTPQRESRKVRYARELVELTPGQGDRMNTDGDHVRYEERKAPRMQYELTAADAMPTADVQRLSLQYRRCIACGIKLEVAKSIERAMGPVCYGRQQDLMTAIAA